MGGCQVYSLKYYSVLSLFYNVVSKFVSKCKNNHQRIKV
nr:MAG TPA: hypothetical protein [Caudoviricetes sp.]